MIVGENKFMIEQLQALSFVVLVKYKQIVLFVLMRKEMYFQNPLAKNQLVKNIYFSSSA